MNNGTQLTEVQSSSPCSDEFVVLVCLDLRDLCEIGLMWPSCLLLEQGYLSPYG